MNDPQHILITPHAHYAILTLNRAAQMNTLSQATLTELSEAVEHLKARMRAIIVTGAGGVFSAGADLAEISQLDPVTAFNFSRRGQAALRQLTSDNLDSFVTIAAIDGYCLGGGLDLALSCNLRFASPRSTFAHPGAKRGIMTGWGGTVTLPRLIGRTAALRLLLTGESIEAAEALRIGLIDESCDDPLKRACAYAESLA